MLYRRLLTFLFATLVLIILNWTGHDDGFLDRSYIYPFLILLSLPCLMTLRYGSRIVNLISRSCVPIGIWISAVVAINLLSSGEEIKDLVTGAKLIFMPLSLGIIYSYLFSLFENNNIKTSRFTLSKREIFVIVIIAISLQILTLINLVGNALIFVNYLPLLIVLVVILVCLVHPRLENLSFIEKLNKASLFICIIGAALGVGLYSTGVEAGTMSMGPAAAITFLLIFIGAGMAYITVLLGGQESLSAQEANYFDWHLIESWAFITLMINPPTTLIESFGDFL